MSKSIADRVSEVEQEARSRVLVGTVASKDEEEQEEELGLLSSKTVKIIVGVIVLGVIVYAVYLFSTVSS